MKLPQFRHKKFIGVSGESIATSYLLKNGYQILVRNFKARYGEIDIICIKDNVLVFVEVKTRTDLSYGTPEESVTPRKLREVVRTAEFFVLTHPGLPESMRIDVIGIMLSDEGEVSDFSHHVSVTS